MREIGYFLAKVKFRVFGHDKDVINRYFRKAGMKIGGGCNICCNIMTTEPYMVRIGENVTISGNVTFVTHDNSISKLSPEYVNLYGYITVGDNCFLGQNSTIMYGCTLANNIIVASGSVVCNSFDEENIIIGGNPARKIGTWDDFKCKGEQSMKRREAFNAAQSREDWKFIKREIK